MHPMSCLDLRMNSRAEKFSRRFWHLPSAGRIGPAPGRPGRPSALVGLRGAAAPPGQEPGATGGSLSGRSRRAAWAGSRPCAAGPLACVAGKCRALRRGRKFATTNPPTGVGGRWRTFPLQERREWLPFPRLVQRKADERGTEMLWMKRGQDRPRTIPADPPQGAYRADGASACVPLVSFPPGRARRAPGIQPIRVRISPQNKASIAGLPAGLLAGFPAVLPAVLPAGLLAGLPEASLWVSRQTGAVSTPGLNGLGGPTVRSRALTVPGGNIRR
jgi:hypothetical protein